VSQDANYKPHFVVIWVVDYSITGTFHETPTSKPTFPRILLGVLELSFGEFCDLFSSYFHRRKDFTSQIINRLQADEHIICATVRQFIFQTLILQQKVV